MLPLLCWLRHAWRPAPTADPWRFEGRRCRRCGVTETREKLFPPVPIYDERLALWGPWRGS